MLLCSILGAWLAVSDPAALMALLLCHISDYYLLPLCFERKPVPDTSLRTRRGRSRPLRIKERYNKVELCRPVGIFWECVGAGESTVE